MEETTTTKNKKKNILATVATKMKSHDDNDNSHLNPKNDSPTKCSIMYHPSTSSMQHHHHHRQPRKDYHHPYPINIDSKTPIIIMKKKKRQEQQEEEKDDDKFEMTTAMSSSSYSSRSCMMNCSSPPIWQSLLFSTIAPTLAAPCTNPFGVARTQLQAQNSHAKIYTSAMDYFRKGYQLEGISAWQRGIIPVMMREASMNLFRIGLYKPILSYVHPCQEDNNNSSRSSSSNNNSSAPVSKRMMAGAIAGAIGAIACNPFEVVRVRLQVQPLVGRRQQQVQDAITTRTASNASSSSNHYRKKGTYETFRNIMKQEGIRTLYRATGTSVALGMVCTSVNMSTYTLFREEAIQKFHMTDGPMVDILCALGSGFFSQLAMNPIDVVRTTMITDKSYPVPKFKNGFHAAHTLYQTEGLRAFMKGFGPSFLRLGPHFVLTFVILEQMRRMAQPYNTEQAQKQFYATIFHQIDTDASGDISKQELYHALRTFDPRHDHTTAQQATNHIFALADTDHSGSIDLQEFLTAAKTSHLDHLLRGQQLLSLFRTMDIDGNGTIDEEELFLALQKIRYGSTITTTTTTPTNNNNNNNNNNNDQQQQQQPTGEQLQQLQTDVSNIMDEIDQDGDRVIDFTEFTLAMDKIDDLFQRRMVKDFIQSAGVAQG